MSIALRTAAVLAFSATLLAQVPQQIARRTVGWPNPTAQGSATLEATVYFPAVIQGNVATVQPTPGGWPVVVFLHGYGLLGADYNVFATSLTEAGFVVVLSDTSQWDYFGQAADGKALYGALSAANQQAGGFYEGSFDMGRVAIVGHSMGGANVANVLLDNPGYGCGMALSPVLPPGSDLTQVHVPVGVVAGEGDFVTPWVWHALPYYQGLTQHESMRFLHVLDAACDHMNFVGLAGGNDAALEFTLGATVGFLRHCLSGDPMALESVLGPGVLAHADLMHSQHEVATPQLWLAAPATIGQQTRISLQVEGGPAALFAAGGLVPAIPTDFGPLGIDPASAFLLAIGLANAVDRVDVLLWLPYDPSFVGMPLALQGLGTGLVASHAVFGNAVLTLVRD
ncbi:MAG: hypothetical protein KF830_10810 [Planctomycetes bacterium]|nr:hypothetical protein [Planctomycetota bacterium]